MDLDTKHCREMMCILRELDYGLQALGGGCVRMGLMAL